MNIQQLKILVLIAEHQKLTTVAEVLHLKQPTVTFHMKKLEQSVGMQLFELRQRRVFLTNAGQALLHYARRIITWIEEAQQVLDQYRHFKKGKVIIGASHTPATYFLPNILGKIQHNYPEIEIFLEIKNSPQIVEMVKKFQIDFGIVAEYSINDQDLFVMPLVQDELGLVLYPDHRLTEAESIHSSQLLNERWILREKNSASRRMFDIWTKQQGIEWIKRMELGATEAIKNAVISRLGISMLSRLAVAKEVKEGTLIFKSLHLSSLTRNIFLIYNRNRSILPIIQEFLPFFLNELDHEYKTYVQNMLQTK